jgi:hypothetical protein
MYAMFFLINVLILFMFDRLKKKKKKKRGKKMPEGKHNGITRVPVEDT